VSIHGWGAIAPRRAVTQQQHSGRNQSSLLPTLVGSSGCDGVGNDVSNHQTAARRVAGGRKCLDACARMVLRAKTVGELGHDANYCPADEERMNTSM